MLLSIFLGTMDDSEFNEALKQYRVIRRTDHYKVRWNTNKNASKEVKKRPGGAVSRDTTIDKSNVEIDAGFWEVLEQGLKGIANLTTVESNRFSSNLRGEHNALITKINLSDLEVIAASLVEE
jgi:hypothetical protein